MLLDFTRALACVAIVVLAPCEPQRPPPTAPEALPVTIPHPGYLDDCVPKLALRPGEQRRFDFECGGVGLLSEYQKWWSEGIDPGEVRLEINNPDLMTCGLCGCGFSLAFETSETYGQLVSMPGRECGKFRRYYGRIQRLRKASGPDRWSVSLESPPCPAASLGSAVETGDRAAVVAFKRRCARVVSRYRSRLNFHVQPPLLGGPDVPTLTLVPHDAELVAGVRSDEVERLRAAAPPAQ